MKSPSPPALISFKLHYSSHLQVEKLQAQVTVLSTDKAAAQDACAHAEGRLAELEAELAEACTQLDTAKHTGTPKGKRLLTFHLTDRN